MRSVITPPAAIAAVLVFVAAAPAHAAPGSHQTGAHAPPAVTEWSAQRRRRAITRIEVRPAGRLYRACTDWYALEHRPSGTVIVPHMRCWWARR